MHSVARAVLALAGLLIAIGGLYDLFMPHLPANLLALCGVSHQAQSLVRELLRALGGALIAIGSTVCLIALATRPGPTRLELLIIPLLVLPAEAINASAMYRVGPPWKFPLAFAIITLFGVSLAWISA